MIIKYKVSDLAKDTGMSNKDVLAVLSTLDGDKKHASQLTEEELDFFFNSVTLNNQVNPSPCSTMLRQFCFICSMMGSSRPLQVNFFLTTCNTFQW